MRPLSGILLGAAVAAILAAAVYFFVAERRAEISAGPGAPPALSPGPDPGAAVGGDDGSAGVVPERPTGEEASAWRDVAAADVIEAYAWFLDAYPGSALAVSARARFEALGGVEALRSREAAAMANDREPEVVSPDPEAALRAQLAPADIAFNSPGRMQYREAEKVELVLSPQSAGVAPDARLSDDLRGEIRTVEGVDYALRMQATLSGPDFEISPSGPQARTVLADRPTLWTWTVRPVTHGPGKVLTLRVEAVLSRDGRDLPPVEIETFSERIVVDVGFFDRAVELADKVKALHATIAGVGTTLVGVGFWLWRNRRGGRSAPPAPGEDADAAAPPRRGRLSFLRATPGRSSRR
jgi:hypothetical protein